MKSKSKIRNRNYFPVIFGVFTALLIWLVYSFFSGRVLVDKNENYHEALPNMICEIESARVENGTIFIKGWAADLGESEAYFNFGWNKSGEGVYINNHFALIDGQDVYCLPSRTIPGNMPKELQDKYPGLDYSNCGLLGQTDLKRLPEPENGFFTVAVIIERKNGDRYLLRTEKLLEVMK